MTKIKDLLLRTILPTTIGTTILMGYFLFDDRLTPRQNIESCNDFYLSNTDYLIFTIVLAGLGCIFKLMSRPKIGLHELTCKHYEKID